MTQEGQEEDIEMIEAPEEVGQKGVALLLVAVVEVEMQPIQRVQSLNKLRIEELAPVMPHETRKTYLSNYHLSEVRVFTKSP